MADQRQQSAGTEAATTPPDDSSHHVHFRRERPTLSVSQSSRPSMPPSMKRSSLRPGSGFNDVHERSPLLEARLGRHSGTASPLSIITSPGLSEVSWAVSENIEETKSTWYLILLTIAIVGLQISWSIELSNGSPYLLGLGISKSFLALVWIAGPLSGTLVQPYVGIKSDRSRSRFGKRRPFMVGGAIATVVSLLALAWTRELVTAVAGIFGVEADSSTTKYAAITFAVIMIYVLDFSINVIQAGVRAFIVDNAPTHQQDSANAWASRLSGVGNIVGYLFGYVDLPKYLGFFGNTQFKVLCVIACIILLGTLVVSCVSISERDPRDDPEPGKDIGGVLTFFRDLFISIGKLPEQIKKVCAVQFFAWIGWFPFLFYITTYVGEIYVDPIFTDNPHMSPEEVDHAWEKATRVGTFALLVFAVCTFLSSVFIPFIVASSYHPPEPMMRRPLTPGAKPSKVPRTPHTPMTPRTPGGTGGGYFAVRRAKDDDEDDQDDYFGSAATSRFSSFRSFWKHLPSPELKWLTLRRAWLLSHIIFAILVWATLFVRSTIGATILVGLIGIPWSMTNWAPYALIAAEISKRDSIRRGLIRPPATHDGELLARGEDPSDGADQAGVVLGIHNVAIAAPQVIATLVSSAIFRVLQKPRGTPGDDSVAWVLRFGGIATLVAAYLCTKIHDESRR